VAENDLWVTLSNKSRSVGLSLRAKASMRVRKEHPDDDNFIIACVGKPEFPEQFRPVYIDTLRKPQSAGAGAKPTLALGGASRPDRRKSLLAPQIRNCIQES